ncbi:MAG: SDR family oxidoreductase [Bacteroidaceae bacterium]|nr:SDR family oxidoreductase [Bacteroidaceae bacterium]
MNTRDNSHKIVAITGASSGIGRATARLFADKKFTVYDLSRSDKPQDGVKHIKCDVTDHLSVESAINTINKNEGRIDILILCAGMGVAGSLEFTQEEEMKRQFDVNMFGPIRVVQTALKLMRVQNLNDKERGRIVFISSMAGQFPLPFQSMYSASKAAINSFASALRNELKDYDIKVTCLMPGDVQTNFKRTSDFTCLEAYPRFKDALKQMESDESNGLTSEAVAKRIIKAATVKNPKIYYTSDWYSDFQRFLARIVPQTFATYIIGKMYHC